MVKNPFVLAPYACKELFCDRKEEMDNILQYLRNGRNITLISPRRLGKTGLIYRVFDEIKTSGAEFDTVYVDISATQSIDDFIRLFAQAVVSTLNHRSRIAAFFSALGGLRPLLSYNAISGSPELRLTFTVLFPEPTSWSLRALFVPWIVETIAMIEAIPMMIPSIVRKERILCDQIP